MLRFKILLAIVIFILPAQIVNAQHHYNAWLRGTLEFPVGDKIKLDAEMQHRRQSGFQNKDLFDNNLMYSFRSWIYYQHNRDVKFSISPFGYFSNYRIIQTATDKAAAPNSEIRISAAGELQHQIFKRFYLLNRNALEYRMFGHTQPDITRFRTRMGVKYNLTEHIKLTLFDEIFLNITGTSKNHFLDHNRVGLNVEYAFLPHLKFDLGYIYLTRLPLNSHPDNFTLYENNMFLHVTYQLKNYSGT